MSKALPLGVVIFVVRILFPSDANAQTCSGSPFTSLTNGNPADASQVASNFTCVLSSPHFSGNVSIGATSTTSALQVGSSSVRGNVNFVGTAFANPATLTFTDTANIAHSYTFYHGVIYGLTLFDQNTSAFRMTWADNGNVGIGTNSPAQALEVSGKVQVDSLASASSTSLCITATSNGVLATCSSSIRYKENVRDAGFGLKEILAMRPVTFKWKGRAEQDFGLIAEEVAKIDPHYVTYKDGKVEGVKYPQLTAVLVNAVKELKAENGTLAVQFYGQQSEIQKLQTALAALQRRVEVHTAQN